MDLPIKHGGSFHRFLYVYQARYLGASRLSVVAAAPSMPGRHGRPQVDAGQDLSETWLHPTWAGTGLTWLENPGCGFCGFCEQTMMIPEGHLIHLSYHLSYSSTLFIDVNP